MARFMNPAQINEWTAQDNQRQAHHGKRTAGERSLATCFAFSLLKKMSVSGVAVFMATHDRFVLRNRALVWES
jgi:hypothetical protein